MDRHEISTIIRSSGVVGIVRAKSKQAGLDNTLALLEGGLPAVEISVVTPGALETIRIARDRGTGIIGAGTVLDEPSAQACISAGAQFLVAPTLNEAVIRHAHRHGVVVLPGVATPTEALRAIELGADFAKLFPASAYGPAAVRDLLVALPTSLLYPPAESASTTFRHTSRQARQPSGSARRSAKEMLPRSPTASKNC